MSARRGLLVVVSGPMASGKSTLARALAAALDAELHGADETREALHDAGAREAFVPGFSDTVYRELFTRAAEALARGRRVVLDGSFRTRKLRSEARELATGHGAAFRFVECQPGLDVCRARIRERERAEPGWEAMFEAFLALYEPLGPHEPLGTDEHIVVDTSQPLPRGGGLPGDLVDILARVARLSG